MEKNLDQRA